MPWTEEKSQSDYSTQASLILNMAPDNTIMSYTILHGTSSLLKPILRKFLEEIDDRNLVVIDFFENNTSEQIFGVKRDYSLMTCFEIHKEDIDKIPDDNAPIRIRCTTNVFPNDKTLFIQIFSDLKKYLSW